MGASCSICSDEHSVDMSCAETEMESRFDNTSTTYNNRRSHKLQRDSSATTNQALHEVCQYFLRQLGWPHDCKGQGIQTNGRDGQVVFGHTQQRLPCRPLSPKGGRGRVQATVYAQHKHAVFASKCLPAGRTALCQVSKSPGSSCLCQQRVGKKMAFV